MQVILLEKIRNLGNLGDTVTVRAGYGRNFLIPSGKAVSASKMNVESFESRRAELEAKAAAVLNEAEARAAKLKDCTVTIQAMASDEGRLYGSIGTLEIAEAVSAKGSPIEKHEVLLPNGVFRNLGEYDVELQLHTDLVVSIHFVIESAK